MNTPKAVVILSGLLLAVVGSLLYLAMGGNVWATGILFSGWSVLCIVIGWSLSMIQQDKAATKEQQTFLANAKENLAMMAAMQTVQNKQNQSLLTQITRLPLPQQAQTNSLFIEEGIFEELER